MNRVLIVALTGILLACGTNGSAHSTDDHNHHNHPDVAVGFVESDAGECPHPDTYEPDAKPTSTCADCDDGNACTSDFCENGECFHINKALGSPCDDGDSCTKFDQCDGMGSCTPKSANECDDGDPCTDDVCGAYGCESTPNDACDEDPVCPEPDECPVCEEPDTCPEPEECPEPVVVVGKSCPSVPETYFCTSATTALPIPGDPLVEPDDLCLVGLAGKTESSPKAAYLKLKVVGIVSDCGQNEYPYGRQRFPMKTAAADQYGWSNPCVVNIGPYNATVNCPPVPEGWEYSAPWAKDNTHVLNEAVDGFVRTFEVTKPTIQSPLAPITNAHMDAGGCVYGGVFNAMVFAWPNAAYPVGGYGCSTKATEHIAVDNVQDIEAYDVGGNLLKVEFIRTHEGAFLVTSQL